jgi:acyl carrier protein
LEHAIDKDILEGKIKRILSENIDIDINNISSSSLLDDELGMDSFDALRVIFEIEDEFEIKLPPTELPPIRKVSDIIDFLLKRIIAKMKEVNG